MIHYLYYLYDVSCNGYPEWNATAKSVLCKPHCWDSIKKKKNDYVRPPCWSPLICLIHVNLINLATVIIVTRLFFIADFLREFLISYLTWFRDIYLCSIIYSYYIAIQCHRHHSEFSFYYTYEKIFLYIFFSYFTTVKEPMSAMYAAMKEGCPALWH